MSQAFDKFVSDLNLHEKNKGLIAGYDNFKNVNIYELPRCAINSTLLKICILYDILKVVMILNNDVRSSIFRRMYGRSDVGGGGCYNI